MINSELNKLKEDLESLGFVLSDIDCTFLPKTEGYRKSECYIVTKDNSKCHLELHVFNNGRDAVNAVANNIKRDPFYYFRQLAVANIWVIVKGDVSQKSLIDNTIDSLMAEF